MPSPSCHYCDAPAEAQCPACGRLYCAEHGDDVCIRCLAPESAIPSAAVYRGSILTLVVATAVAAFLIVSPPSDESSFSEVRESTEVPAAEPTRGSPGTATSAPTARGETPPAATSTSAAATATPTGGPAGRRTHTVQPGDNPSTVAEQYGVSLDALIAANPGVTFDPLAVDTVLVIPEAE